MNLNTRIEGQRPADKPAEGNALIFARSSTWERGIRMGVIEGGASAWRLVVHAAPA